MKNEKVLRVQFHIAREIDGRSLSSANVLAKENSNKLDGSMTLIPAGVLIETKKSRRIVPYSNIQEIILSMEEEK